LHTACDRKLSQRKIRRKFVALVAAADESNRSLQIKPRAYYRKVSQCMLWGPLEAFWLILIGETRGVPNAARTPNRGGF